MAKAGANTLVNQISSFARLRQYFSVSGNLYVSPCKNQKLNRKTGINQLLLAFLVLVNSESCGFAYEEYITGRYYIVGVDISEERSLCYSLSGRSDYVGKAPGQLQAYGFNDTFLVAKTSEHDQSEVAFYSILDMRKDGELAHEEDFRVGPISESDYNANWSNKLNIPLKEVDHK